jgi:hypothetical protein
VCVCVCVCLRVMWLCCLLSCTFFTWSSANTTPVSRLSPSERSARWFVSLFVPPSTAVQHVSTNHTYASSKRYMLASEPICPRFLNPWAVATWFCQEWGWRSRVLTCWVVTKKGSDSREVAPKASASTPGFTCRESSALPNPPKYRTNLDGVECSLSHDQEGEKGE